ncbi:MAG: DUF3276 family protein [Spirochaetia bacterium]|jgi:hypothetical protein|nr:DUF3276 family protein [Spirochaetia bacterium]HBE46072.1 hypothetical protein [Spirochaetaceae bacterium]
MGIRGELFSTRFSCEGRTYFFNVKENRNGDLFLSVVESKPTETESFDRRSIVVFNENLEGFMRAFRTAVGYMEKAGQNPKSRADSKPHDGRLHGERPMHAVARRPASSIHPANSEGAANAENSETLRKSPRRIVIKRKPHSPDGSKSSGLS